MKARLFGQAAKRFFVLPYPAQVRAQRQLQLIAGWPNVHAPGTLGIEPGTRLRAFVIHAHRFTYSAPRPHDRVFFVWRIDRIR